jgi:hypothetical protein
MKCSLLPLVLADSFHSRQSRQVKDADPPFAYTYTIADPEHFFNASGLFVHHFLTFLHRWTGYTVPRVQQPFPQE